MSTSLFLIFNHELTSLQESDARYALGVEQIRCLPSDIKTLWRKIPSDLPKLSNYLAPVKEWLARKAKKNDYTLIQGDFGATYIMVNFAFEQGLIPIYSTTQREAFEETEIDGSVRLIHQFKHQIFRRYGE